MGGRGGGRQTVRWTARQAKTMTERKAGLWQRIRSERGGGL